MSKSLKDNPYLDEEILYGIAEDVDLYADLKAVCDSSGGQVLVDTLINDAVSITNQIADNYSGYKLEDFQARAARLSVVLNLARSMLRAGENLAGAEDALNSALRE